MSDDEANLPMTPRIGGPHIFRSHPTHAFVPQVALNGVAGRAARGTRLNSSSVTPPPRAPGSAFTGCSKYGSATRERDELDIEQTS